LQRAALLRRCTQALRDNFSAVAAIDMALLDLLGRHFGLPVCELLGGALRTQMQTMGILGGKTVAEDVAEAQAKYREGYRFFKLKAGVKPIADDIRLALELRAALGPDVKLCADANMGLSFEAAREFVTAVAGADWFFLEQPFGKKELPLAAELARVSAVAIGADEGISSAADIVAHYRAGAAAGVALKTIKLGGVAATVRAAHVCKALGLAINLSSKMAESSVGASCLVHVGAVLAETAWGVCPSNHYLSDDIVKSPLAASGGMLTLPDGAGLGVDVDEAAVARYRA
jgi:L-alanine-DL-glutamate epimerase-like enolase superfamily enzyme